MPATRGHPPPPSVGCVGISMPGVHTLIIITLSSLKATFGIYKPQALHALVCSSRLCTHPRIHHTHTSHTCIHPPTHTHYTHTTHIHTLIHSVPTQLAYTVWPGRPLQCCGGSAYRVMVVMVERGKGRMGTYNCTCEHLNHSRCVHLLTAISSVLNLLMHTLSTG